MLFTRITRIYVILLHISIQIYLYTNVCTYVRWQARLIVKFCLRVLRPVFLTCIYFHTYVLHTSKYIFPPPNIICLSLEKVKKANDLVTVCLSTTAYYVCMYKVEVTTMPENADKFKCDFMQFLK